MLILIVTFCYALCQDAEGIKIMNYEEYTVCPRHLEGRVMGRGGKTVAEIARLSR